MKYIMKFSEEHTFWFMQICGLLFATFIMTPLCYLEIFVILRFF